MKYFITYSVSLTKKHWYGETVTTCLGRTFLDFLGVMQEDDLYACESKIETEWLSKPKVKKATVLILSYRSVSTSKHKNE